MAKKGATSQEIDEVIVACAAHAQSLGYRLVYGLTENQAVLNRVKRLGFVEVERQRLVALGVKNGIH